MFISLIETLIDRVNTLSEEYVHDQLVDKVVYHVFPALQAELTHQPDRNKIDSIYSVVELIDEAILESSNIEKKTYEYEAGTDYKLIYPSDIHGVSYHEIFVSELTSYRENCEKLLDRYEPKVMETYKWSANPIELNISVAHLGMLISCLYRMEIISDSFLKRTELCRLLEKYCITKSKEPLRFKGLYNSLSSVKGSEIPAFVDVIIDPMKIEVEKNYKVSDYKKNK